MNVSPLTRRAWIARMATTALGGAALSTLLPRIERGSTEADVDHGLQGSIVRMLHEVGGRICAPTGSHPRSTTARTWTR